MEVGRRLGYEPSDRETEKLGYDVAPTAVGCALSRLRDAWPARMC